MYRLQINSIGRSAGRRAVASAAYRAGERLRDERSGKVFNYSSRKDVLHKEIILPSELDPVQMGWARDRATLWNAAEKVEKRSDSRVAREYEVNLPAELAPAQRLELARRFSLEIADRYGVAVDLAVHEPRKGGDPRNFHAHLLTTTREVTPAGLGAKTGLDMQFAQRERLNLPKSRDEYLAIRERWAIHANDALRAANLEARVDHRSFAARGIDREPHVRVPMAAYKLEKRGGRSEVAERLRADYDARVAARQERTAARERAETASLPVEEGVNYPKNIEEIQRNAAQAWLQHRAEKVARGVDSDPALSSAKAWLRYREEQRALEASAVGGHKGDAANDKNVERDPGRTRQPIERDTGSARPTQHSIERKSQHDLAGDDRHDKQPERGHGRDDDYGL